MPGDADVAGLVADQSAVPAGVGLLAQAQGDGGVAHLARGAAGMERKMLFDREPDGCCVPFICPYALMCLATKTWSMTMCSLVPFRLNFPLTATSCGIM